MALNDKERTQKVAKAWHYFQKLEDDNRQLAGTDLIKVDDSEMINAASWAMSYFTGLFDSYDEMEKIRKSKISFPTQNMPKFIAENTVDSMVFGYASGERKFPKYAVKEAKKLCRFLTEYIEILEKENNPI